MSYDQGKAACERCDLPRIEIDAYGMHLRGCLGCNTWQVISMTIRYGAGQERKLGCEKLNSE